MNKNFNLLFFTFFVGGIKIKLCFKEEAQFSRKFSYQETCLYSN